MWLHSHLFGPHPLCCSVKPRIGCDKPVGVSSVISFGLKSMLFQTPPSLLSFFLFFFHPSLPSHRSTCSFNAPPSPDTETHSRQKACASHATTVFPRAQTSDTDTNSSKRQKRERLDGWPYLLFLLPQKIFDSGFLNANMKVNTHGTLSKHALAACFWIFQNGVVVPLSLLECCWFNETLHNLLRCSSTLGD